MDKPKEFWIFPQKGNDCEWTNLYPDASWKSETKPLVHVIEYSAYEQLQKKFEEAVEVIKIIDLNFNKITKCPDNSCDGCHEDAKIAAEYSSKLLNSLDKEK